MTLLGVEEAILGGAFEVAAERGWKAGLLGVPPVENFYAGVASVTRGRRRRAYRALALTWERMRASAERYLAIRAEKSGGWRPPAASYAGRQPDGEARGGFRDAEAAEAL